MFRSIVDNGHKFKARVIPKSSSGCCASPGPQSIRTQWIPEDICSHQAFVLLERYEGANFGILQKLQGMCSPKGLKTQFEKQIFEPGVQLMEFVSMDLIGEFHPPTHPKVTGMH